MKLNLLGIAAVVLWLLSIGLYVQWAYGWAGNDYVLDLVTTALLFALAGPALIVSVGFYDELTDG